MNENEVFSLKQLSKPYIYATVSNTTGWRISKRKMCAQNIDQRREKKNRHVKNKKLGYNLFEKESFKCFGNSFIYVFSSIIAVVSSSSSSWSPLLFIIIVIIVVVFFFDFINPTHRHCSTLIFESSVVVFLVGGLENRFRKLYISHVSYYYYFIIPVLL